MELQGSLLSWGPEIGVRPWETIERIELSGGAWVDVQRNWVVGADVLFERLVEGVAWRAERRAMYDRQVDVPRLLASYDAADPLPDPALLEVRRALNGRYGPSVGGPVARVGLCLYRDGRDSVAWHGDTIGRGGTEDVVVAIVSLGWPRRLHLRPRAGGPGLRFEVGGGDLLVMGGSCQRTWEHAVPKSARPVGPRISVQFRPSGVA